MTVDYTIDDEGRAFFLIGTEPGRFVPVSRVVNIIDDTHNPDCFVFLEGSDFPAGTGLRCHDVRCADFLEAIERYNDETSETQ